MKPPENKTLDDSSLFDMVQQDIDSQGLSNQNEIEQAGAGPREPRSSEEQQRVDKAITELFEHRITFNEHLGMRIRSLQADSVVIAFDMRPELIGHYLFGRLHGGVISSALDATGGLAVMQAIADYHKHESALQIMSRFRYLGTVDLRVDFLRQGIGESFNAEAKVLRLGRRIAATAITLHNDSGSLIATGNATYIVS